MLTHGSVNQRQNSDAKYKFCNYLTGVISGFLLGEGAFEMPADKRISKTKPHKLTELYRKCRHVRSQACVVSQIRTKWGLVVIDLGHSFYRVSYQGVVAGGRVA